MEYSKKKLGHTKTGKKWNIPDFWNIPEYSIFQIRDKGGGRVKLNQASFWLISTREPRGPNIFLVFLYFRFIYLWAVTTLAWFCEKKRSTTLVWFTFIKNFLQFFLLCGCMNYLSPGGWPTKWFPKGSQFEIFQFYIS